MEKLIKKPTQCEKVLKVLEDNAGKWVSGDYFLRELYLSQYHARIFELQRKGYNIVSSQEVNSNGFKSYKLIPKETLW